jgi:putative Ca2+/H+ antiporter (TMEM165/GDT1 family)
VGELLAAIGLVFLAELGDKTQLVALGFGARYRLGPVLVGVALGYAACNVVSVVVGGLLGAALPTRAIGIGGGLLFLGFAAWTWFGDDGDDDGDEGAADPADDEVAVPSGRPTPAIVGSVAVAMFVAELGDKTMLATATLAAQGNPVLVWVGATIGIFLAGAVGVLVGRTAGARLPEHAIKAGSAVLFALFGVALIATNL